MRDPLFALVAGAAFGLVAPRATPQAPARLYVDAVRGHDANSGTYRSPLRSITAGLKLAGPGTHVIVLSGTYGPRQTGEVLPLRLGFGRDQRNLTLRGVGRVRLDLGGRGGVAVHVGRGASGGRITGITFTDADTKSWWTRVVEAGSYRGEGTAADFEIDRCRFEGIHRGIVLWDTKDPTRGWRIHNNVFVRPGHDAICELSPKGRSWIFDNTIVGGAQVGVLTHASATIVANNVVVGCRVGIATLDPTNGALRFRANDVWRNGKDWDGVAPPPGNYSVDPRFVDAAHDDYRLAAGSPLIDAGIPDLPLRADPDLRAGAVDGDGDGVTRPDVGAYERTPIELALTCLGNTARLHLGGPRGLSGAVVFSTQDGVVRIPGLGPILVDAGTLMSATVSGTLPLTVERPVACPDPGTLFAHGLALDARARTLLGSNQVERWDRVVEETFATTNRFDANASSGTWGKGAAGPGVLGGDGLLGDFDHRLGSQTKPGVWEWSTDRQRIPADRTLSGREEIVTDGTFRFARLSVPAGVTVVFRGKNPARLFVAGEARIEGSILADGESPAPHDPRNAQGQSGGRGGPGGGRGGKGGDQGDDRGHRPAFDGQRGESLRLPAGHAYRGRETGTGGAGSVQYPTSGLGAHVTFRGLSCFFSAQIAAGGGGGGFLVAGQPGRAVRTTPPGNGCAPPRPELGPPALGGTAFSLFPVPPGASSLVHFAIGGSGGGGGGTHPFFRPKGPTTFKWRSGAGGAGGGGVVVVRAGRALFMGSQGLISARGGSGARHIAPPPAPGGGGSGGSVLLQTAGRTWLGGLVDVRGGKGGFTVDQAVFKVETRGGDASHGYVRLETPGNPSVSLLGRTLPPAGPSNVGPLRDTDPVTVVRSLWYRAALAEKPVFRRYEVDAVIDGRSVRFSDDPRIGPLAGAGQPVRLHVQGAKLDAQGKVIPGTVRPWRTLVGARAGEPSLATDDVNGLRFALVFDRSLAKNVAVRRVAVFYR